MDESTNLILVPADGTLSVTTVVVCGLPTSNPWIVTNTLTPLHDWTVALGGNQFGLVEWPAENGTHSILWFGSHTVGLPVGAAFLGGVFATLSGAIIIAALAFRARHRHTASHAA